MKFYFFVEKKYFLGGGGNCNIIGFHFFRPYSGIKNHLIICRVKDSDELTLKAEGDSPAERAEQCYWSTSSPKLLNKGNNCSVIKQ